MVDVKVQGNMFITKGDGTLRDTYKIGKVLGEGAFGEVRLCTHRESGEKRAVKVLKKVDMEQEEIDAMLNEINILKGVDHPNIVKIYEYFEDAKRFYIVTQHIEGGELFDSIIKFGTFSEHDAAVLTRQMLSVISYCHNKNIVHRDLKPENIMLESEKSYEDIKIIDFGTAQVFDPSKHLKEQIGTPYYIAPEVLNKKYGKECDLWSSGVIVFILLSGIPPFNGVTDNEIMAQIKKGKFNFNAKVWNSVSAEAKDFIIQLLTLDASKRPTAEQAMQHPWLVKQSKVEVNEEQTKDALAHLTMFHKNNTLKTATFSFIGSQLISKDEKEGLAKVFKTLDRNGDGRLSKDEV
jgi:calcium-dependent protein kinase